MARKLNTKFIAAVAALGAVGAGGLWFGPALMRPSIAKLTAEGEAAVKAGNYDAAVLYLGKAANRDQNNIPLSIEFLDAMDLTVRGDAEKFRTLRQMQARVLATDPRSVPALQRVMTFQVNDVRNNPADNATVRNLVNTAQRILQLQPGDVAAQKAMIISVLEPYSRNLEVLPEALDRAKATAKALYDKDPADSEALQMLVRFGLMAAQRDAQQGDDQTTQTDLDAAAAVVDAAVAKTPQSGTAWMSRFNVYRTLATISPNLTPDRRAALNKAAGESLDKANQYADPKSLESFMSIRAISLRLRELMNIKEAEAGYRKLLTEAPNDRQTRIMLADFLDRQPARRDEAAAVLEKPWTPTEPLHALESRRQAVNGLIEQVRLCTIKLGAIDVVTDPAERAKRLADVEKLYGTLQAIPDINAILKPAMLRLEGGIALEHGRILDAINSLDSALKLLSPDSPYSLEQDMRNDVLLQYAQAQLRLGQTGKARPALVELVGRRPDNLTARATLADLLIREHNYTDASQQIAFLRRVIPDNPVIERMNVRMLALRSDTLRDYYKDMPETTRDQRLIKLQAAATLGEADEVSRIARLMLQSDPGDLDAVTILAQVLAQTNHRDEAVAAVVAAQQAKPAEPRLKSLLDALNAQTPEDQVKAAEARIAQIKNPLEKALSESDLAQQRGKTDESIADLKKAMTISAADPRAPDALFRIYVSQKKWDDASALLEKLGTLNVDQTNGQIRTIQLAAAKALADTDPAKRDAAFAAALNGASNLSQQYREIANASLLYAQLLQQSGDASSAADQYAQALDKSPTNVDALVGSVQCLMSLGRVGEARSRLDQAGRTAPDDQRLHQLELSYQMQYGDPLRALDALQSGVDQNPKNPLAWGQLATSLDEVAAKKTAAHDDAGALQFTQRAADKFEQAAGLFPDDLRFPVALAEDKRRLGDSAGAEQVFAKLVATEKYKDNPQVVEILAEQYTRSGKTDDAERVLRGLIDRVKPAPVSAVLRLSFLYSQLQRLPDALATLDIRRDSPEVQRQRVQLLVAANDLDKARAAAEDALASDPSADTYLIAAYVELRSNHFEKAGGFLNRVFQLRPNDAAALFYRAQVELNANPPDVDGARDDLMKARDLAPGNVEARVALADVFLRKQDRESAVSELQKAWKTNPTSKLVLLKLVNAYATSKPPAWQSVETVLGDAKQSRQLAADPDVLLAEANMWVSLKDSQKAVDLAKRALAASPTNADLQQRYFDTLLRAGDYRGLIAQSDPVLQADQGAWWLYRLRGQAYKRLDQRADAAKNFDAAFNLVSAAGNEQAIGIVIRTIAEELDPPSAIAKVEPLATKDNASRLLLAGLYQATQNYQGMFEQLDRVMTDRPRLRDDQVRQALQMLGSYYLQSSPPDLKKARATFEDLLKQSPNDILVLNNLADVLTQPDSGGTPAEALKYSQRAFDLANSFETNDLTAYVLDTQGWVLIQNKKIDEGLDLLRRAAETAQFPDVFLHLAEADLMKNDVDGADLALADAKRMIVKSQRNKQPVDPLFSPKMDQLAAEIANRRTAKTAAG